MTPTCPKGYTCEFDPVVVEKHHLGPWWETGWGIVVGILVIVAVATVLITLAYYWLEARREKREERERAAERMHKLAIEEQRTMQIDSAKGDPEMLKLVRSMQ